jgi:hypothetical protein
MWTQGASTCELHFAPGRLPWEEDIFDIIDEDTPSHRLKGHEKKSWRTAFAARAVPSI